MLIKTHQKLAEIIYYNNDKVIQDLVCYNSFRKGSIAPDIKLKFKFVKHRYNDSISIVKDLIKDILNNKQTKEKIGYKLGIIAHFVTDYACTYHSNEKFIGYKIVNHLKFENEAHKYFDNLDDRNIRICNFKSVDNIESFLKSFVDKKMQDNNPSPQQDLFYAYTLTSRVVNTVIEAYHNKFFTTCESRNRELRLLNIKKIHQQVAAFELN